MPRENFGYKRLRIFFWCAAIVLGATDAWATRFTMNPDGVSYLDLGDAWWRGDGPIHHIGSEAVRRSRLASPG